MAEPDPVAFGAQVRQRRTELCLSQAELARRLGWPVTRVVALEAGRLTVVPDVLDAIDRVLGEEPAMRAQFSHNPLG